MNHTQRAKDLRAGSSYQATQTDVAVAHFDILGSGPSVAISIPALDRADGLPFVAGFAVLFQKILGMGYGQLVAECLLGLGGSYDQMAHAHAIVEVEPGV